MLSVLATMKKCFPRVYTFVLVCSAVSMVSVYLVLRIKSFDDIYLSLDEIDQPASFRHQWLDPPVTMQLKVHMFNITNRTGDNFWLNEVGPFVYDVEQKKVVTDENELFLTYRPFNTYYFNANASQDDSQMVRTMNVPLFTLLNLVHEGGLSDWVVKVLKNILAKSTNSSTTVEHPVSEYLFDGYTDALLEKVFRLGIIFPEIKKLLGEPKFGFLMNRNNSNYEGNWTVFKGHKNAPSAGQLLAWNEQLKTDFYAPGSSCNLVRGSNGEKFKNCLADDTIYLYLIGDMCTAVPFKYVGVSSALGYETRKYEFKFNDTSLDSCFASDGLHDASPCNRKAPIVFSAPNFSGLSWHFANNIFGLQRQSEENASFIEVEPRTGVVLKASIKLQANLVIQPYADVNGLLGDLFFASNESLVVPLMKIEQTALATGGASHNLTTYFASYTLLLVATWVLISLLVISVPLIYFIEIALWIKSLQAPVENENESLISEDGDQ